MKAPKSVRQWRQEYGIIDRAAAWHDSFADALTNSALSRLPGWQLAAIAAAFLFTAPLLVYVSLQIPWLYLPEGPSRYVTRLQFIRPNLIVDREGQAIAELFAERTGTLQPEEIPAEMKATLLFVEDADYYSHGAVRWLSILRAIGANTLNLGYSQGGSTITQQLARILLGERQKSIIRKLRETALADYLEEALSKEEILAAYMNLVYLGHGARGFEVAARYYFDKDLAELSFNERLLLSCLPSAPERFSPLRNPRALRAKMVAIFDRMQSQSFPTPPRDRFLLETDALLRTMQGRPAQSVFGARLNEAPYVAEHVRLFLREVLGPEFEYGAGLTITTTIDRKLQLAAARESRRFIDEAAASFPPVIYRDGQRVALSDEREKFLREYAAFAIAAELYGIPTPGELRPRLQTASIGIDPSTGGVLFMQGGARFDASNQLNRAIQMRRQTGSAIKPVVYSAAIESGALTAASILDDRPIYVSGGAEDRYWLPHNFSGVYEGPIPVRKALAKSQNIPAIQAARAAGMERLGEQFRKFFFPDEERFAARFRADETAAIGSIELSPLEMASAFGAFAANGVVRRPFLIQRIVDPSGQVLYEAGTKDEFRSGYPMERKALDGAVAEVMVSLMQDSARFGGVARSGISGPVFGKTGTSNDFRDAWFVGGVSGAVAAVWVGYDSPGYSMAGGTGAALAGPLWGRILREAPQGRGWTFSPRAVRHAVCESTGRQPAPGCARVVSELFTPQHGPPPPAQEDLRPVQNGDWSLNRDSDFR